MNVVELKNVSKVYDPDTNPTLALENVSMHVEQGEFVAIMGLSGSGKSTLMNIIGLLDVTTTGEYLLDGHPVNARRDAELARLRREKIGFVFQSFNLIPRLTLQQNIELPMIYGRLKPKERKIKSKQLLELVGLGDRANFRPNNISGGQTQRAAIARALANSPSLILADEPTGNLDTKSSRMIMDELHRLHKTGTTIVIVTHNPELAAEADRIIEISDGKVTEKPARRKPTAVKRVATRPHTRRFGL